MVNELRLLVNVAIREKYSWEQTTSTWWQRRILWATGGTSSNKKPSGMPAFYQHAIDLGAKRDKKTILANMSDAYSETMLNAKPRMVSRVATKHEPGLKRRPLHATDDASYLIASYASANVEKLLSIDGMVMRQTPEDVREATQMMANSPRTAEVNHKTDNPSRQTRVSVCNDYSDFFMHHGVTVRCVLNAIIAQAYSATGQTARSSAALWIAKAHLNHHTPAGRIEQGLSSGERDTARDNTLLHHAYAKLVERMLEAGGCKLRKAARRICGDDEVMFDVPWDSAMDYIAQHQQQGYRLQPKKCMVSSECAEFLQYNMFSHKKIPTQPLAPAIINFVSGSWYKTANYNKFDYPEQLAQVAHSCTRRGANPHTMFNAAVNAAHWLCDGIDWKQLLVNSGLARGDSSPVERPTVDNRLVLQFMSAHRTRGVDHYVRGLANLGLTLAQQNLAREAMTSDIYAGMLETAGYPITTSIPHKQSGPNRLEPTCDMAEFRDNEAAIWERWIRGNSSERIDPKVWLTMQTGIPQKIITRIGLKPILLNTPPSRMAIYGSSPPAAMQHTVHRAAFNMLPGAIAPYFKHG